VDGYEGFLTGMVESITTATMDIKGLLLDTTVLIDLSRGNQEAADFINLNQSNPLAISVISAMELVVGCRNKAEVSKAEQLFAEFTLLQVTPEISRQAYEWLVIYNKSHGLKIPDALIAATALVYQFELVTDNVRDFNLLSGLAVWRPY
jgi:predicted nucleic acid-binding protein